MVVFLEMEGMHVEMQQPLEFAKTKVMLKYQLCQLLAAHDSLHSQPQQRHYCMLTTLNVVNSKF